MEGKTNSTVNIGETYPPMLSSQVDKWKYSYTVTVTFPPTNITDVSVIKKWTDPDEGSQQEDITSICFKCSANKYSGLDFEPYFPYNDMVIEITLGSKVYEINKSLADQIYNDLGTYALIPEKQ